MSRGKNSIIERLLTKRGLRARVDAHCVSCVYDDLVPGTWRQQVEQCTVISCPIWDTRTKSRKSPQKSQDDVGGIHCIEVIDITPETQQFEYKNDPRIDSEKGKAT